VLRRTTSVSAQYDSRCASIEARKRFVPLAGCFDRVRTVRRDRCRRNGCASVTASAISRTRAKLGAPTGSGRRDVARRQVRDESPATCAVEIVVSTPALTYPLRPRDSRRSHHCRTVLAWNAFPTPADAVISLCARFKLLCDARVPAAGQSGLRRHPSSPRHWRHRRNAGIMPPQRHPGRPVLIRASLVASEMGLLQPGCLE